MKKKKGIFINICPEKFHQNKLEYFCKTHNKLCCVACISKIASRGYGQHLKCDICDIEEISFSKLPELIKEKYNRG